MIKDAKALFVRTVKGVSVFALMAVVGVVGMAQADAKNFPHFRSFSVTLASTTSASGFTALSGGSTGIDLPDLHFSWAEVGVGNTDIVYELRSVVTAKFACKKDGPKTASTPTVTAPITTTLMLDKNGRINGSVVLDTSLPTKGLKCQKGYTLTPVSVTFSQNTITDTTNGVTATDDDIQVIF